MPARNERYSGLGVGMRWVLFALLGMAVWWCAGCNTSGGALPFDPANPPTGNAGALPGQFTQTQGANRWWYYASAAGTTVYTPLSWGAPPAGTAYVTQCWLLNGQAPYISKLVVHPGAGQDAVLAWKPPAAGQAQITLTMESLNTDSTGDGIEITAWQGNTRILNPAQLANRMGQSQSIGTQHAVVAGDLIYLRFSARDSAESDWFSYQVTIQVQ